MRACLVRLSEWMINQMLESRCDYDDDDDDCQLVDRPNIHGKAMLVAHTGPVSLPNDKQRRKKTRMYSPAFVLSAELVS